ncbi:hypothetical protein B0H14DRAFT_2609995 [Mycena olivaceomarginata]|nr:hypothetical protein B0H14DRAFT_2609995 [Mycena olivaceomarginata]
MTDAGAASADAAMPCRSLSRHFSPDKRGRKKIEKWVDANCGLDRLLGKVHREMDDLGTFFKRYTNDVTPESLLEFNFEDQITEICLEHTPTLRRILLTAAQTPRTARENTVKNPEPVLNLTAVLTPANYLLAGNNDPGQDSLPEQQSLRHSLHLILSQLCYASVAIRPFTSPSGSLKLLAISLRYGFDIEEW